MKRLRLKASLYTTNSLYYDFLKPNINQSDIDLVWYGILDNIKYQYIHKGLIKEKVEKIKLSLLDG